MTMESSGADDSAETLTPSGPSGTPEIIATEADATHGTQARGSDGKFGAKADKNAPIDLNALTRNEIRKAMREEERALGRLADETDKKALDNVKPSGKGKGATADPAPASAEATKSDKSEGTSPGNTAVAKHLDAARKALALDGLTEEDLAGMKPERILALGKKAHDRQAEIARKLEDAAKATKAQPTTQARATEDGGSQKPTATAKPAATETLDDFDAIAKEAVGQYDEADEHFSKSMGKLAKSIHTALESRFNKALETQLSTHLEQVSARMSERFDFERAIEALKDDFPQLDTQDGRDALVPVLDTIAQAGTVKTIREAVKASAYALWGEERERAKADEAKAQKSRDARKNGQPVSGQASIAANRQGSSRDSELQIIRDALASEGKPGR